MDNFKVSAHFNFFELTKSKDHPELIQGNREYFAREPFLGRLILGAEYALEGIRSEINNPAILKKYRKAEIPLMVNNGGRFPELNSAVGGATASQHLFGRANSGAFDMYSLSIPANDLGKIIMDSGLRWHQLRIYVNVNFIHFGMPLGWGDGQVAIIK
jgi:hypothetical protein